MSVAPMIGKEIGEEIQLHFVHAVDAFYEDYDPRFYIPRGYYTYKASTGEDGDDLFSVSDNGEQVVITAGIYVDSGRLGSPYKDPAPYVFTRTWAAGIHGVSSVKVTSPSPKKIMDEWFNSFKNSKEIKSIVNKWLMSVGLRVK